MNRGRAHEEVDESDRVAPWHVCARRAHWVRRAHRGRAVRHHEPVPVQDNGPERSLFVAVGTVNAYVDFSGLAEGDLTLSVDGRSVKIRLPEGKLDKPNLDLDRTYLFSQERGVVNRIGDALSVQDQSELYKLAEQKLVSAAEESELAQQAEENTRAMLTGMFKSLDIEVTFTDDARKE
jgi:hypothetical protein